MGRGAAKSKTTLAVQPIEDVAVSTRIGHAWLAFLMALPPVIPACQERGCALHDLALQQAWLTFLARGTFLKEPLAPLYLPCSGIKDPFIPTENNVRNLLEAALLWSHRCPTGGECVTRYDSGAYCGCWVDTVQVLLTSIQLCLDDVPTLAK